MRLFWLYLRSRPMGVSLAGLGGIGALAWLIFDRPHGPLLEWGLIVTLPLLATGAVIAAVRSPFGDAERAVGTRLPRLRTSVIAGLLIVAAGDFLLTGGVAGITGAESLLIRNLAGFAGLALLAGRATDFGMGWLVPAGFGAIAFARSAPRLGDVAWWCWPLQSADAHGAFVVAAVFLMAGFVVVAREARTRLLPTIT